MYLDVTVVTHKDRIVLMDRIFWVHVQKKKRKYFRDKSRARSIFTSKNIKKLRFFFYTNLFNDSFLHFQRGLQRARPCSPLTILIN